AVVVEPHRRHRGEVQRLEHVAQPLHRPRSLRCMARGVRPSKYSAFSKCATPLLSKLLTELMFNEHICRSPTLKIQPNVEFDILRHPADQRAVAGPSGPDRR